MRRFMVLSGVVTMAMCLSVAIAGQNKQDVEYRTKDATKDVTFSKDVAPIVYANCVYCHRPGEVAPFSLLTYPSARPWARAIKRMVAERRMPPWLADPHYSSFSNDRRLTDQQIQTIVAWVDGDAREGNPATCRRPRNLPRAGDWRPGSRADNEGSVQDSRAGVIPWVSLPSQDYVFPEASGCAIEIRPGNRSVVHHAVAQANSTRRESLHLFSPGMDAMIWRGCGKLIRKGRRSHFRCTTT
jgi:hypothetical protein